MAVLLNSTSYLRGDTAMVTGAPLTMACWFNAASLHTGVLMSITDASAPDRSFHMTLRDSGELRGTAWNTATGTASAAAAYSPGGWRHAAFVCRSASDRSVYLDGGARGDNSTSVTPPGIDTVAIGRLVRNGSPFNLVNTQVAEAAIWDVELNEAEIKALALGLTPHGLTQRIENLRFYSDLVRPPVVSRVGPTFTAVGSLQATRHPRRWSPTRSRRQPTAMLPQAAFASALEASASGAESGSTWSPGADAVANTLIGEVLA